MLFRSYPEDTAGRLMQTEFVAVPDSWTVARTLDYTRQARDLPDRFVEIYVVDPRNQLRGTVPVSRLLRSSSDQTVHQRLISLAPIMVGMRRVKPRLRPTAIRMMMVPAGLRQAGSTVVG